MVNAPPSEPNPDLFRIPDAAVARHPGALLAPRELRHWLDGLPLGNPPKAAQQVLHQLRLLVRDPQPGARLTTLLQIYDAPIRQLLEIVDERLQGNGESAIPLDQLEYALLDLLTELACGHLRVANDLLSSGKTPTVATLYQAMSLLDSALNIERLHYCRLVPENWQLLLQIYRFAAAHEMGRQAVDTKLRLRDEPTSIEGLFYRALVISLCDPHHHRPNDIMAWHQWTGTHTELLELTVLPQGPFAIPVDTSGAMQPLTGARCGKPGSEILYLAADAFLQRLQDDPAAPKGLYLALNDLIKGRKSPEQRQSPRQPRNHPFQLIHGLRYIHARLEALTHGSTGNREAAGAVACRQLNQSRSGSAFQLHGPPNPPLTVGETILLEAEAPAAGSAPIGFAGRIQRLVTLDDQMIEIGVEKLPGRLIPVEVTGSAAERARGNPHALLQHAVETGQFTLIAPRSLFREGDVLAVESTSARYSLRMTKLLGTVQHIGYIAVESLDA